VFERLGGSLASVRGDEYGIVHLGPTYDGGTLQASSPFSRRESDSVVRSSLDRRTPCTVRLRHS
jgi:hypothetical protein